MSNAGPDAANVGAAASAATAAATARAERTVRLIMSSLLASGGRSWRWTDHEDAPDDLRATRGGPRSSLGEVPGPWAPAVQGRHPGRGAGAVRTWNAPAAEGGSIVGTAAAVASAI